MTSVAGVLPHIVNCLLRGRRSRGAAFPARNWARPQYRAKRGYRTPAPSDLTIGYGPLPSGCVRDLSCVSSSRAICYSQPRRPSVPLRASPHSLDRVVRGRAADGYPAQFREFLETGMAAEFAVAAVLHAAEGHLGLVVDGRAIDVADSEFEFFGHAQGAIDVTGEDGARKAVGRVVGDAQRVLGIVGDDDGFGGAKRFFAVHAHRGRDAIHNRGRITHAVGFSAGENFRALGDGG